MFDFDLVEGFEWDVGNARKNVVKHGVSQSEAEQVFFNKPLLLFDDERHSTVELRFHAYGKSDDGRHMQVSFTLRNNGRLVRVISARNMSRKERAVYDQEI